MVSKYSREDLKKELFSNVPETKGKTIIIWGTGNTSQLYQEGLARLSDELTVTAYCDNNKDKWGQEFGLDRKPVIKPDDLAEYENALVLICTPTPRAISAISHQLEDMGVAHVLASEVILKRHADQVLAVYDTLGDDESKAVYADVILAHIQGRYPMPETHSSEGAYFALTPFRRTGESEVFIDCGAFVGDTVEQYIWQRDGVFGKVIAFEPDGRNYAAMQKRVMRLKEEWNLQEDSIVLFPCGVGDESKDLTIERYEANNGLATKFVAGGGNGEQCSVVALDDQIAEPYSFLKADIESFEYKMLLGAQEGIKKNKPLLAVCIYHNAVDLYSIPCLIKKMVPEYKMAVRHHLNTLAETVLYCWCD